MQAGSSLQKQQTGTCKLVFGLQADCFMFVLQRSPEFNDFLRKALDKNVDNRWSSVQLLQVSCPSFASCAVISQFANIDTALSVCHACALKLDHGFVYLSNIPLY